MSCGSARIVVRLFLVYCKTYRCRKVKRTGPRGGARGFQARKWNRMNLLTWFVSNGTLTAASMVEVDGVYVHYTEIAL